MFSWIFLKKYYSALCTEDKWVNVDIKHQTIAITLVCRPLTSCITTISVNTTTSTLVEYDVTLKHTKLDKHDHIEIHSQRSEVTICERWYDNPLKTVIHGKERCHSFRYVISSRLEWPSKQISAVHTTCSCFDYLYRLFCLLNRMLNKYWLTKYFLAQLQNMIPEP